MEKWQGAEIEKHGSRQLRERGRGVKGRQGKREFEKGARREVGKLGNGEARKQ